MSADSVSTKPLRESSTIPQASSPAGGSARRRSGFRRALSYWWVALLVLAVGFVLFLIVLYGGFVQGEEFSPETFQTREFVYYELPLIKLQVTGVTRTVSTPDAAVTLTQKNMVTTTPASKTWHLVWVTRGIAGKIQVDDAALLIDQLRSMKDGAPAWSSWTNKHPKQAAVLWPIIAKLARRELYLLMPRLFELTRDVESSEELRQVIDDYLRREYLALIDDMRAAGKNELADELAAEAKEDFGDLSR